MLASAGLFLILSITRITSDLSYIRHFHFLEICWNLRKLFSIQFWITIVPRILTLSYTLKTLFNSESWFVMVFLILSITRITSDYLPRNFQALSLCWNLRKLFDIEFWPVLVCFSFCLSPELPGFSFVLKFRETFQNSVLVSAGLFHTLSITRITRYPLYLRHVHCLENWKHFSALSFGYCWFLSHSVSH